MFIVLGKFQLFISICSGFWSLFANFVMAFAILTNRKSCCWPGCLFKEVKDVVAYITFVLKG
jgi:hypothetical protein